MCRGMQEKARPSAEVPKACGRWPSGGAHKKIIPNRSRGFCYFLLFFGLALAIALHCGKLSLESLKFLEHLH